VDTGLSSSSFAVVFSSVNIMLSLSRSLPQDHLSPNVLAMVFTLFPLFEDSSVVFESSENAGRNNEKNISQVFLETLPSSFQSDLMFEMKNSSGDVFNTEVVTEAKKTFSVSINRKYLSYCRLLATDLIVSLLSTYPEIISSLFYIPDYSSLLSIRSAAREETKTKSLSALLSVFVGLLNHQCRNARYWSVKVCRLLLEERKEEFYQLIPKHSLLHESSSGLEIHSHVSELFNGLMLLSSKEKDESIRIEIVNCLGEIGALDSMFVCRSSNQQGGAHSGYPPSHFPSNSAFSVSSPRGDGVDSSKKKNDSFSPWNITPTSFGIFLLTSYVVPSLKSAEEPSLQDYSGLAIQEILRSTAESHQRMTSENNQYHLEEDMVCVPEFIVDLLKEKNIFDICEPFWETKYKIKEAASVKELPIYSSSILSFTDWLGFYTKYCVSVIARESAVSSSLALSSFYFACNSLLRFDSNLCQFLLPYLLLDIALLASLPSSSSSMWENILKQLLNELIFILKDSTSEMSLKSDEESFQNHRSLTAEMNGKCVQVIFSIFDLFSSWSVECLALLREKLKSISSSSSSSSEVKQGGAGLVGGSSEIIYQNHEVVFFALSKVINYLPLALLSEASFNNKFYARSLKYIELDIRNNQRNLEESGNHFEGRMEDKKNPVHRDEMTLSLFSAPLDNAVSRKASTGGGDISGVQLLAMANIFTMLEAGDSLHGINAIRRRYQLAAAGEGVTRSSSFRFQIIELKQSDDWLSSLLEYELLQNSSEYRRVVRCYETNDVSTFPSLSPSPGVFREGGVRLVKKSPVGDGAIPPDVISSKITLSPKHRRLSSPLPNSNSLSSEEVKEVERGKARCLIELGHLDTVISNVLSFSGLLFSSI
jgi:hypothetical protein